jgi:hypothetical protein
MLKKLGFCYLFVVKGQNWICLGKMHEELCEWELPKIVR